MLKEENFLKLDGLFCGREFCEQYQLIDSSSSLNVLQINALNDLLTNQQTTNNIYIYKSYLILKNNKTSFDQTLFDFFLDRLNNGGMLLNNHNETVRGDCLFYTPVPHNTVEGFVLNPAMNLLIDNINILSFSTCVLSVCFKLENFFYSPTASIPLVDYDGNGKTQPLRIAFVDFNLLRVDYDGRVFYCRISTQTKELFTLFLIDTHTMVPKIELYYNDVLIVRETLEDNTKIQGFAGLLKVENNFNDQRVSISQLLVAPLNNCINRKDFVEFLTTNNEITSGSRREFTLTDDSFTYKNLHFNIAGGTSKIVTPTSVVLQDTNTYFQSSFNLLENSASIAFTVRPITNQQIDRIPLVSLFAGDLLVFLETTGVVKVAYRQKNGTLNTLNYQQSLDIGKFTEIVCTMVRKTDGQKEPSAVTIELDKRRKHYLLQDFTTANTVSKIRLGGGIEIKNISL